MSTAIKDFKTKEQYFKIIREVINKAFRDNLFLPLFDIINKNPLNAINDMDVLRTAIREGKIYYVENGFKSRTKRFNNKVAFELEKMGAVYDKNLKIYKIPKDKLPPDVLVSIAEGEALTQKKIEAIDKYLNDFLGNIDEFVNNIAFNTEIITILDDANAQINKNTKNINIIVPELDITQQKEIAESYTENMRFYIKKWAQKDIPEFRKKIQKAVLEGYREDYAEKILSQEYGINQRKAKFLAQNETSIMLAQYRKVTYKRMGFNKFRWATIMDGKERELHAKLNGQIFSFDNPPIIDERTGQTGLPGETYNCYHKDTEVLTKDGFKLIKDVKIGEEIASIEPETKKFEWQKCTNTVSKKVENIAIIKNNIFELAVSLDHTFFYYKYLDNKKENKKGFYPVFSKGIESLARKNTAFYASSDNWQGISPNVIYNIPTEVFCKFMGYYLSDGYVDKRTNNCIHIAQQNNDWMFEELKPFLKVRQGKEKLYIYNVDLFNLVAPLGKCNTKRIPELIKNLDKKYIRIFLDSFAKCDGKRGNKIKAFYKSKIVNTYNQYYTTSKLMMSDLAECIYKTGMSASVYIQKNKGKEVIFRNGKYKINFDVYTVQEMKTKIRRMEQSVIEIKPYNDYVYDIEVEKNHTLLIKYGKSIHFNSNCRCSIIPISNLVL